MPDASCATVQITLDEPTVSRISAEQAMILFARSALAEMAPTEFAAGLRLPEQWTNVPLIATD